jgi:drug/metabolite transporter (DMT)-like permease
MLLNEKLTRAAILGLGLAILGGTVIGLSDACVLQNGLQCPELGQILQGRAMWGNFLALAGAWAVTGYLIIGSKLRAGMSLIPYIFPGVWHGGGGVDRHHARGGTVAVRVCARTYGWIFLMAAVPQLIGHSTYNWLLKQLSATLVAITTLAEPLGSAFLAYIILDEIPKGAVMVGGLTILAGIYLVAKQPSDTEQA